jgi:hypothetical protein
LLEQIIGPPYWTIGIILALVAKYQWPIKLMDIISIVYNKSIQGVFMEILAWDSGCKRFHKNIYYILKHDFFMGRCMVTTVPSRICNETK